MVSVGAAGSFRRFYIQSAEFPPGTFIFYLATELKELKFF
jgi:hypothetical protein